MALLNSNGTLNQADYANKLKKQQEVFAQLDTAMAVLEKLPVLSDSFFGLLNASSFNYSASPLDFLFNILKSLGVSEEELRQWIVEILVYVLPGVEVGLKGLLLSNLKSLVSCNSDARIPAWLRKDVTEQPFQNLTQKHQDPKGIVINVGTIDPDGMLDLSPFTQPGELKYFGCVDDSDDATNSDAQMAKLVRADDFNAFLWYVIHKGNKQNPFGIQNLTPKTSTSTSTFSAFGKDYELDGTGLRGCRKMTCLDSKGSDFKEGATFYDVNGATKNLSMIISSDTDNSGKVTAHTLVEVSSDWYSCNWYVNKSNYYGSNLGAKKNSKRNYSEEKGICNIKYMKETDFTGRPIKGSPDNLVFSILPKPSYMLPYVGVSKDKVAVQTRIIRLMFDENGESDKKGRYSIPATSTSKIVATGDTDIEYNASYSVQGTNYTVKIKINPKTGKYWLGDAEKDAANLVECYPGLTVYEFNYDYIMGMKLFDPKVVCQRVLEGAANAKINVNFSLSHNKTKNKGKIDNSDYPFYGARQRLLEVVRQVLEEDEEINDCFYNFSNEQYEEMMNASDKIRYNKSSYTQGYDAESGIDMSEVYDILNEFSSDTELDGQKDIINRALEVAAGIIEDNSYGTSGVEGIKAEADNQPGSKGRNSSVRVDFMTNILQQLISALVDSLLSPKVLMLLLVNQTLMNNPDGGNGKVPKIDTEALMSMMKTVIRSLVKEIRDMIMKKILDYILKLLAPIALQIQMIIASEQLQAYLAIIKLLLSWLMKGLQIASAARNALGSLYNSIESGLGIGLEGDQFKDGSGSAFSSGIDLASVLDNITYADIYPQDNHDSTPIITNC